MKPLNRHEKAVASAGLAAGDATAEIIGGLASDDLCNTTDGPFRAIGEIARDVVANIENRARIAGTLHPRWRV